MPANILFRWAPSYSQANRVDDVIQGLELRHPPIFCAMDVKDTSFFGSPCAVIPVGPFRCYYNPAVYDILSKMNSFMPRIYNDKGEEAGHEVIKNSDEQVESVVKGYKIVSNYIPDVARVEIILDCAEYFIVSKYYMDEIVKKYINKYDTYLKSTEEHPIGISKGEVKTVKRTVANVKTYKDIKKILVTQDKVLAWMKERGYK